MYLKQELNLKSKNTNPKIKNLKITIFSNPSISSNPKTSYFLKPCWAPQGAPTA